MQKAHVPNIIFPRLNRKVRQAIADEKMRHARNLDDLSSNADGANVF